MSYPGSERLKEVQFYICLCKNHNGPVTSPTFCNNEHNKHNKHNNEHNKLCVKFIIKGQQMHFSLMNVILLHSDHRHVSAAHVTIFRVVSERARCDGTIAELHSITFFFPGATQPIVGVYFTVLYRPLASSLTSLLDHTQRRATVGRTPLKE
jgi:hypothetical protein